MGPSKQAVVALVRPIPLSCSGPFMAGLHDNMDLAVWERKVGPYEMSVTGSLMFTPRDVSC